jgi:hypothetical protein
MMAGGRVPEEEIIREDLTSKVYVDSLPEHVATWRAETPDRRYPSFHRSTTLPQSPDFMAAKPFSKSWKP